MHSIRQYLEDYKEGRIQLGKGITVPALDEALRYKQGQFNIINGIDNVGKTAWMLWYFLCLSVHHDLKWIVWSGENKGGQLVRQLIEFYTGQKLKELTIQEIYKHELTISNWFVFVDNSDMYKSKDLFKIFTDTDAHGCLIDPYTGLNRGYTHADNYDFLNESREFCNATNKTLYLNTHPNTSGANMIYPPNDALSGYKVAPGKSQSEGGQPFANRCDDFITIHRHTDHPTYWSYTEIYVRKVKDTETGGAVTKKGCQISFEYNGGLGFTNAGINPLGNKIKPEIEPKIEFNDNFINETKPENDENLQF